MMLNHGQGLLRTLVSSCVTNAIVMNHTAPYPMLRHHGILWILFLTTLLLLLLAMVAAKSFKAELTDPRSNTGNLILKTPTGDEQQ
jgi:hypothetical protein